MRLSYPCLLRPTTTETSTSAGKIPTVPKVKWQLRQWMGASLNDTFGNKPRFDLGGRAVFAERCVYELVRLSGWQVRWVETYGAGVMTPHHFAAWVAAGLAGQQHEPIPDPRVQALLLKIAQVNGSSYAGCWDVVGWNGGPILFAELKRRGKDRIRPTQPRWLAAG